MGAAHPDHSAPGLGSRYSLMTPSVRSVLTTAADWGMARFVPIANEVPSRFVLHLLVGCGLVRLTRMPEW